MLLCGVIIKIGVAGTADAFYATLLSISGLGATRATSDTTSNADAAAWGQLAYSCIARLTPFTLTFVDDGSCDWVAKIKAAPAVMEIVFPAPSGHSAGAKLSFTAGLTNITFQGSIEERGMYSATVSPTGAPTYTAPVAV